MLCSCLTGVKSGWSGGFKNGDGELGGGPVGKEKIGGFVAVGWVDGGILFEDEADGSCA